MARAPWRPTTRRTPPNTAAGESGAVRPAAPRVKGGIDLVGDSYNADPDSATYQPIPHPDPNPLDCVHTSGSVGHGSHVAGTAAGSGVLANGTTYTGPYNATTISGNSWTVGPGVAPKADLYAVRVFGCDGSTDVTVDAIEWAVDNDMDVINMSLGSSFGTKDDPSAVATTNAAKAGVVVVTSAGNSGAEPVHHRLAGHRGRRDRDGSERSAAARSGNPHQHDAADRHAAFAAGGQRQRRHHRTADHGRPLVVLKDNPATTADIAGIHRFGGRVARLLTRALTRSTASFPAAVKSRSRSAAPALAWPRRSSPSRPARPWR